MKKFFINFLTVTILVLSATFYFGGVTIAHAQVSGGNVGCHSTDDCVAGTVGASYDVSFTTDDSSPASTIEVYFPHAYYMNDRNGDVPLSPDHTIMVNGVPVSVSSVSANPSGVIVNLATPTDLSTGTVTFTIANNTSITNPSTPGTTDNFSIITDAANETSENDIAGVIITPVPFTITDASVSGVSSGDLASGVNGAQYHVGINTAASFNSNGNEGSIAVTFPTGYSIPQGSIPTSDICALQSSDCGYVYGGGNPSYSITSVSGSRNTITVNFDSSHGGNDTNYGFYMQAGAGIRNPSTVGTTEFFKIAADGGIPATAGSVTITSPVPQVTDGSVTCVTTNDCAAGAFGTYDVSFLSTNSSAGAVQITFPSGYPPENTTPVITTEAGRSNYITVNGTDYQIMGANASGNTLTVYFQSNIDLTAGTVSFRFGPGNNMGSPGGIANPVTLGQTGNFSITTDASGETPESDIPGVTITNPFSDFAVSGNSANDLFSGTGPSIYKVSFTAAAPISNSTLAITFPSGYSLPQGSLSVNAIDGFGGPLNFKNGQSYGYFYIFIPGRDYSGIPINSFSVSGNTMTISLGSAYSEGANEQVQFYLMDGSHGSSNAGITNPSTPETTGDFSLSFNGDTPVTAPGVTITPEPIATKFMVSDSNDDNGGTIGLQAGRSGNFTIVATDANGNIAPGYDPTGKTFTFTDSNGVLLSTYISPNGTAPTIPQSSDITSAVTHGNAFVPITLTKAGTVGPITVSDGTLSGTSDPVDVVASSNYRESSFAVVPSTTTPTAGIPFSISVTALDGYGNILNNTNTNGSPFTGLVNIATTATAPYNLSPEQYFFTDSDNGTKTFTNGVTLDTAGNGFSISATNIANGQLGATGTSPSINVEAAPVSSGGGGGGGGGAVYGGGPTGSSNSITINNGALTTTSQTVNLSLFSSSATEVMISNDPNFGEATWEPFTFTKQWTLSDGNGKKTIYFKFKDSYGSESSTNTAVITLNLSAALAATVSNSASSATNVLPTTTISNSTVFAHNLKKGMTSLDVVLLQKYLRKKGFPVTLAGKETSFFGIKTQKELILFQKSVGLGADGSFGPKTRVYVNAHIQ